jgi:hypothetical protein
MTSVSHAPRNGDWVLQAALIASIFVHLAFLLLGTIWYGAAVHADPAARSAVKENEIVRITSVLRIERSAARVAAPHTRSENDPRHVAMPAPFGFARAAAAPQQTAVQRAFADAMARHFGSKADPRDPARVPDRIRLAMDGLRAKLKRGQGIYYPIRGWRQDGLDYYDAAYEFIYPDGSDERGTVPWPIHFPPDADPFFSADPLALSKTPLPGPPAGYVPPGDLGKALRAYFPSLHFEDSDN